MDQSLLTLLSRVDTPTVCNAIEVVEGKRGFDRFTRGTVLCSDPEGGAMVGYARTAKIAAVAPPTEAPEVIKQRRMDYYRHMASGPRPAVAVIEDLDGANAIGAFWGEINTTVHKGLGLSGALTNGVMRDLGDLPEGFPRRRRLNRPRATALCMCARSGQRSPSSEWRLKTVNWFMPTGTVRW